MARRLVITLPDAPLDEDGVSDDDAEDVAEYVDHVALQVREGYVSGHVDSQHHWTFEEGA